MEIKGSNGFKRKMARSGRQMRSGEMGGEEGESEVLSIE